jgi:hypothetical protein
MSKLFYRLDSLIKYLKHNNLLDGNYEPFISKTEHDKVIIEEYKKLINFFENTNDMFKDIYLSFIHEYEQELNDNRKRERAKNAKTKLLEEYRSIHGEDSKPTDQYIYQHVNLTKDLKPYLNLSTPYNDI